MSHDQAVKEASAKHPTPAELVGKFQYGTAGFRMKAKILDSVVYRVGLLASLRSRKLNGQTIGVMITASHNPPEDNGVKLVDPMGEMLEASWEKYATQLANADSDDHLVQVYNELVKTLKVNLDAPARVIFARDTRASGSRLVECLNDALTATKAEVTDYRILTTPQLHYLVRCVNTKGTQDEYGEVSEKGYYEKLAAAFKQAMEHTKAQGHLTVDCANGVGGPKLRELLKYLPSSADGGLDVKVVNDDVHKPETLNHQCGADFVKTNQRAPPSSKAGPGDRCCSLDGDADRIVYYFQDEKNVFRLLDGDRIATLAASFIAELARQAGLMEKLTVGVVQTAYANGASTTYIQKNLGLQIVCTPTGVKHLHHAATRFDVGVYFEANGHGTVVFSPSALKSIHTHQPQSPAQADALTTLMALTDLINQTVGDALSDMLLVEVILAHKGFSCAEWLQTYTDLPNRLVRVEVADRNLFTTVEGTAERQLATPAGAQKDIEKVVAKYKDGRSFARASGTEDAVRVYAEASTRAEAEDLAAAVAQIVRKYGAK
ncbi:Phosphoacetylglucosamine mutase, partial [Aureobasidium melanogenum]